jgi:hypothetical protein
MSSDGFLPQSRPNTGNSEFNVITFLVKQLMSQMNVATLVKVVAVYPVSTYGPVGTVDVLPLVEQVDGSGRPVPHAVVHGLPYLRIQGGAVAIILDPKVDDIGFCVFADKDISSVKATRKAKPPGSKRRFNLSDGIYLGGWNRDVTPTTYIQMDGSGIQIKSPAAVNIYAPTVDIVGNLHVTGAVTGEQTADFTGDVTGQGTHLHAHVHSGVTTGGDNTGNPV